MQSELHSSNPSSSSDSSDRGGTLLCPPALTERGLTIGERLGGGQFASVYKAKWKKLGDKEIAVKRIIIADVPEMWRDKCMKLEMKIIKKLQHPNIIKVHDIIKTRKLVFIFMDLAASGTMFENLVKANRPFTERQSKIWSAQLVSAISYIHQKGIAHRDIKLENFLLDADFNALLSDFGFACLTTGRSEDEIIKITVCGTPEYMAPEIRTPPYDAKKTDMFAMGVCIFEMINFHKPWNADRLTEENLVKTMLSRNYKFHTAIEKRISDRVKDLINKLLEPNPARRLSAIQMMEHSWMDPTFLPDN